MMKVLACVVVLCVVLIQCQNTNWRNRACLVGFRSYYGKVMQETFTKIEKEVKWCNLRMLDRGRQFNEWLFKWHATGTVNYTNGFVTSVEKIDLTDMVDRASVTTVNGTEVNELFVQGRVNLRELRVGYDVTVNLDGSGTHRFTGEYPHTVVAFETTITWNPSQKKLSTAAIHHSTASGLRHMIYRPSSNITEMIGRETFWAYMNNPSFEIWAREIIAPRMLEVAKALEFPAVRFDNKC